MRTSLLVANSGGLSFTSLTLMLTRTLVSWWWPPAHTHTHTHTQSRAKNDECSAAYKKIQSSVKFIIDQMSFVACLWLLVCLHSNPCLALAEHKANYEYFPARLAVNQSATQPAICYFWFAKKITDTSLWDIKISRQPLSSPGSHAFILPEPFLICKKWQMSSCACWRFKWRGKNK